jgi:hypothetical protein
MIAETDRTLIQISKRVINDKACPLRLVSGSASLAGFELMMDCDARRQAMISMKDAETDGREIP